MAPPWSRWLAGALLALLLATPEAVKISKRSRRKAGLSLESGWKAAVTLSKSNSPLTQQIAGGFAPAGSTVSTVVLEPAGSDAVVGVAFTPNASASIVLTLLNPDRLSSGVPVRATVGVLVPGSPALKYGLVTVAGAKNQPPAGPKTIALGAATLGVPLLVPESSLLAGWSDPDGNTIGVISARVRDRRRGSAAPTALAPASWSPVAAIAKRRITELAYTCQLSALTVRRRFPGASARKPKCVASGGKISLRISDARYSTKPAVGTVAVSQGAVYPHMLKGIDGGRPRAMAKLLGFGAAITKPAIAAGSLTWPGGLTASVAPPASSTTAVNMTFAAAPTVANGTDYGASVTLTLPAGVTYFGLRAALPFPTKGSLKLLAARAAPSSTANSFHPPANRRHPGPRTRQNQEPATDAPAGPSYTHACTRAAHTHPAPPRRRPAHLPPEDSQP